VYKGKRYSEQEEGYIIPIKRGRVTKAKAVKGAKKAKILGKTWEEAIEIEEASTKECFKEV